MLERERWLSLPSTFWGAFLIGQREEDMCVKVMCVIYVIIRRDHHSRPIKRRRNKNKVLGHPFTRFQQESLEIFAFVRYVFIWEIKWLAYWVLICISWSLKKIKRLIEDFFSLSICPFMWLLFTLNSWFLYFILLENVIIEKRIDSIYYSSNFEFRGLRIWIPEFVGQILLRKLHVACKLLWWNAPPPSTLARRGVKIIDEIDQYVVF